MAPEDIMLSKKSLTEKDKYGMISCTCRIQNKPNSPKQRVGWQLPGAEDWGKLGRCWSKDIDMQLEDG